MRWRPFLQEEENMAELLTSSNGATPMDETKIAQFMGQVSEALKNQNQTLQKLENDMSELRGEVSELKAEVKLLRTEKELVRSSCDKIFADYRRKFEDYESRFARDFARLDAIERDLKTRTAEKNGEENVVKKQRSSVEYAIVIIMAIISLISVGISYKALQYSKPVPAAAVEAK